MPSIRAARRRPNAHGPVSKHFGSEGVARESVSASAMPTALAEALAERPGVVSMPPGVTVFRMDGVRDPLIGGSTASSAIVMSRVAVRWSRLVEQHRGMARFDSTSRIPVGPGGGAGFRNISGCDRGRTPSATSAAVGPPRTRRPSWFARNSPVPDRAVSIDSAAPDASGRPRWSDARRHRRPRRQGPRTGPRKAQGRGRGRDCSVRSVGSSRFEPALVPNRIVTKITRINLKNHISGLIFCDHHGICDAAGRNCYGFVEQCDDARDAA